MSFKFSFTRTVSEKPAADKVRTLIVDALRGLNKKLHAAGCSEPYSIKLDATIEVTPKAK